MKKEISSWEVAMAFEFVARTLRQNEVMFGPPEIFAKLVNEMVAILAKEVDSVE